MRLAAWQLALAASVFIVSVDNARLFGDLFRLIDETSLTGLGLLLAVGSLMVAVLFALMLVLGTGRLLKPVVASFLLVSATAGYYVNELGVVFDQQMFVNIGATIFEGNWSEARELASAPIIRHVLLFGALPAMLLLFVRLDSNSPLYDLRNRVLSLATAAAVAGVLLFGNYRFISYFAVEHRDLRFEVTPIHALVSLVRVTSKALRHKPQFRVLGADAKRDAGRSRRIVGVMVVGETARADHFSLNGYAKPTNPVMAQIEGLHFLDTVACGTSTAYSVPCIFFLRGREAYSPTAAISESNVLDILQEVGVESIWIDNNSTCKHVCDRIPSVNLRVRNDGTMMQDGAYDIALVEAAESYMNSDGPDILVVLHMMGSHGPAYSRRYPEEFAVFSPSCHAPSPKDCSIEEIENAYDNSIVYTDYVIGELIERLEARSDEFDSFLLYVSDHGESLGENGVYLHGMPYVIAPESQTNVPLVLWTSPGLRDDVQHDHRSLPVRPDRYASHDNVPHTLLGLYGVRSDVYREDEDLVSRTSDHERVAAAYGG